MIPKSLSAYWDPDKPDVIFNMARGLENLSVEELLEVARELDRRMFQLWEKIEYENRQRENAEEDK